jgi:hypothetical protein
MSLSPEKSDIDIKIIEFPSIFITSKNRNISGIYQIRNLLNGNVYIGKATSFYNRWTVHLSELRNNIHFNKHLQNAWNKYGEENFVFDPLITCPKSLLNWYEGQFIELWKPEYNIIEYYEGSAIHCGGPETYVGVVSPEGIEYRNIYDLSNFCREQSLDVYNIRNLIKGKIIKSTTGWTRLPEEIEKNPLVRKKPSVNNTPEVRENRRNSHLGKKATLQTREKMSISGKGKKHHYTEEGLESFRQKRKERVVSEETREKSSVSHKGKVSSAKTWFGLVSPEGIVYNNVYNLNAFCKEHSLNPSNMFSVLMGERSNCSGWTKIKTEGPNFVSKKKMHANLVAPDGTVYRDITNLKKFCKDHNISYSVIRHLLLGHTKKSKIGWIKLIE